MQTGDKIKVVLSLAVVTFFICVWLLVSQDISRARQSYERAEQVHSQTMETTSE